MPDASSAGTNPSLSSANIIRMTARSEGIIEQGIIEQSPPGMIARFNQWWPA